VKNTSTDEGDKPEKVYKYDDRDRFSDSDDSQESSPHPAGFTDVTPPPGALDICTLILPRMCILGSRRTTRASAGNKASKDHQIRWNVISLIGGFSFRIRIYVR
jgi:hypothetical protein